jgi:hypothetical protein
MKKIFEDMVPSNRKSIRDVSVPDRSDANRLSVRDISGIKQAPEPVATLYGATGAEHARSNPSQSNQISRNTEWANQYRMPENVVDKKSGTPNHERINSSRRRKLLTTGAIILLLIVLVVFLMWTYVFAHVEVTVTPRSKEVNLSSAKFQALKTGDTTSVPYDIVVLTQEGVKKVAPSGERQVQKVASGKVTIFNAYSAKPQRLIRNTRLQTPDGLIFRIADSISIPGKSVVDGKDVPGSVTTTVLADTPGDKNNIPLSDFTIPGFKGDPRYTQFYARSVEPMTGGYVGTEKVVSDDILHSTQSQLQIDTIKSLSLEVRKNLSKDQVLYDGGIYSETELEPSAEDGNMVAIKEKVTLYAVVFSKANLAKYIAEANISSFDNSPVEISNADNLTFSIINKDQVRPWVDSGFSFTLSGTAKILWTFDEEKLKSALVGQPKQTFFVILPNFPSILSATPHFSPAWKSAFPDNSKDILVKNTEK